MRHEKKLKKAHTHNFIYLYLIFAHTDQIFISFFRVFAWHQPPTRSNAARVFFFYIFILFFSFVNYAWPNGDNLTFLGAYKSCQRATAAKHYFIRNVQIQMTTTICNFFLFVFSLFIFQPILFGVIIGSFVGICEMLLRISLQSINSRNPFKFVN